MFTDMLNIVKLASSQMNLQSKQKPNQNSNMVHGYGQTDPQVHIKRAKKLQKR